MPTSDHQTLAADNGRRLSLPEIRALVSRVHRDYGREAGSVYWVIIATNEGRSVELSCTEIADAISMSRRQVFRETAKLERARVIRQAPGRSTRTSVWFLSDTSDWQSLAASDPESLVGKSTNGAKTSDSQSPVTDSHQLASDRQSPVEPVVSRGARGLGTLLKNSIEPRREETEKRPPVSAPLGPTPADEERLLEISLEQVTLVDAVDYRPPRGGLPFRDYAKSLRLKGATPEDLLSSRRRATAAAPPFWDFLEWWETVDWRGTGKNGKEPGRRPNPDEVPEQYRRFLVWRKTEQAKGSTRARAAPAVDAIQSPILRGAARLAAKHVTRTSETDDEPRPRMH